MGPGTGLSRLESTMANAAMKYAQIVRHPPFEPFMIGVLVLGAQPALAVESAPRLAHPVGLSVALGGEPYPAIAAAELSFNAKEYARVSVGCGFISNGDDEHGTVVAGGIKFFV